MFSLLPSLYLSEKYVIMETSVMNGKNLSKLDFNYMIVYRPKSSPRFEMMEENISSLFNNTKYKQIAYYWERDIGLKKYHSHILTEVNSESFISDLYSNIEGTSSIHSGTRQQIVKMKRENNTFQDIKMNLDYVEFYGKKGKLFVEPIIQKENACFYVSKYSNRGLNSGYLMNT